MTREEILAMKPGRELNEKVAREVIGGTVTEDATLGWMEGFPDEDGNHVWDVLNPYSEDLSAAERVVDEMIAEGFDDAVYWADFGDGAYTEPEAICKRALLTVLGDH